MSKKINFDFYKVSMPDQSLKLEDIFKKLVSLPIQDRIQEVRSYPVFLHQAECVWRQCWEGDIIRLRMDDLPVKGNLSGNIENLIFSEDEGIGEQTAFLFHPSTRILLLQSNQSGVLCPTFIKYFEMMGGLKEQIFIDPVIQSRTMEKLDRMNDIQKFEIRVAGLDKMSIFRNQNLAVDELIKLSEEFRAPSITMNLAKTRRKQESLFLNSVKDTAMTMLRINSQYKQEVKKLRISGSIGEEEQIYIDLLQDRMRESIIVKKKRTLDYSERRLALRQSWERREEEIFSMYGKD